MDHAGQKLAGRSLQRLREDPQEEEVVTGRLQSHRVVSKRVDWSNICTHRRMGHSDRQYNCAMPEEGM